MSTPFLCFAHRGAKGYEPENTLPAFEKAIELHADWIELDVYHIENELVVFHDLRLNRTTNGTGFIFNRSLDYIRSLDAGNGAKIPFLSEVIDLVDKKAGINIELKGPETAVKVADMLNRLIHDGGWSADQFMISSFRHAELLLFQQLMPNIRLGALTGSIPLNYAKFATDIGAYSLNPTIEFISREFINDAHSRGLKVFVYTVNHSDELEWMRELDVDGVFSDYPDIVKKG